MLCSANLGFVLYAAIVLYFICNLEHDRPLFLSKSPECKLDLVEGSLDWLQVGRKDSTRTVVVGGSGELVECWGKAGGHSDRVVGLWLRQLE